jgi:hypothetical protein
MPFYEINPNQLTWAQHKAFAASIGRTLATVLDQQQHDRVVALLTAAYPGGNVGILIGGLRRTDVTQINAGKGSAYWRWDNGSTWKYENWLVNQPDNLNEGFLEYNTTSGVWAWNDVNSTTPRAALYMYYGLNGATGPRGATGDSASLGPNSVNNTHIADNAVTTTKILDGNVTLSKLNSNVTSLLGASVSAPNLVFWADQARTAPGTNNLLEPITNYNAVLVNFLTINQNNTSNATLTLPYSGTYIFTISGWRCGAGGGAVRVQATRNGTVVFDRRRAGATSDCSIFESSICWNLFLAGDVVRLYKNQNSGGTNNEGAINFNEDGVGPVRIVYHGGINTNNIGDLSVTGPKIADNAVTELKINNNAVTENKINNNAVTVNKIADFSVTYNKLAQDVRDILASYGSRISSLEYNNNYYY